MDEKKVLLSVKPNKEFYIDQIQDGCSLHVCSESCKSDKNWFGRLKMVMFPKTFCKKRSELDRVFTSIPLFRIKQRLFSLGLIPGTRGVMVGQSPLSDPIIIDVDGRLISIRRVEAELILVKQENPE